VRPSTHETEVSSLSDEALVREMLPLASNTGCKLAASAVLLALLSGWLLGPKLGAAVLAVCVALTLLALWRRGGTHSVQRARAAERELRRRFGAQPLAERLDQVRAQLAADTDLQVVGLFRGTVLPHGGLRSIRFELRAQPQLHVSRSPGLAELQRGVASSLEILRRDLPLPAAQVERVRAVLRELGAHPPTPLASFVSDGFVCEASVLQRDGAELHASVNLAGLPDQLKQHPSVRLVELFLDLEAELLADARLN
jgi:hypothetical protein